MSHQANETAQKSVKMSKGGPVRMISQGQS